MNTDDTMIEKNIELSAEFSRYLFEHPEIEASLPMDAEVVLLPEFDPALRAFNQKLGQTMEAQGENVAYVRIGPMRPRALSRIESLAVGA